MNKLFEFWNGMDFQARLGLVAGLTFILLMTVFLSFWVLGKEYQILYTGLSGEEASAISKLLDAENISYQLDDGGASILVDRKELNKTRLLLAGEDVALSNAVGFEIFDEADYGMTEFTQKVNYQRGLQGELERTINKISGVSSARVHLVMPENKIFQKDREKPKAAVNMHMKSGFKLSHKQIGGIQSLVASAVDDLEKSSVAIFDQNGVLLSQSLEEGVALLSTRLSQKKELEQYLLNKASSVLENVYGEGIALVNIDVQLNYNKRVSKTEKVLPSELNSKQAVVKLHETRVKKQEAQIKTQKKAPTDIINETQDVEYAFGRSFEEEEKSVGSIERITVSILVPGEIDDIDLQAIKALIANSVGLNPERGDIISAERVRISYADRSSSTTESLIPHDVNINDKSQLNEAIQILNHEYVLLGAISLLITVILVLLYFSTRSQLSKREREQALDFIRRQMEEGRL